MMRISQLSAIWLAVTGGLFGTVQSHEGHDHSNSTASNTTSSASSPPVKFGIILFRAFDLLDLYGPLEVLQYLSNWHHLEVELIHVNMSNVLTRPQASTMNPLRSEVWPELPPTHTFENASKAHDVFIIPGGLGIRTPNYNSTLDYIRETAPKAKHIITICTGSVFAARAGIMNGRRATTNKASWPVAFGPNTTWVESARWVVDETYQPPVWSSSGVTAGIDLMLAFVEKYYGAQNASQIVTNMEFERIADPSFDPFSRNGTRGGGATTTGTGSGTATSNTSTPKSEGVGRLLASAGSAFAACVFAAAVAAAAL